MWQLQVFILYNLHVHPSLIHCSINHVGKSKFSSKTVRYDEKLLTCFMSSTPLLVTSSQLILLMTGTLGPLLSSLGSTCKHEIWRELHKNMGICPFITSAISGVSNVYLSVIRDVNKARGVKAKSRTVSQGRGQRHARPRPQTQGQGRECESNFFSKCQS